MYRPALMPGGEKMGIEDKIVMNNQYSSVYMHLFCSVVEMGKLPGGCTCFIKKIYSTIG